MSGRFRMPFRRQDTSTAQDEIEVSESSSHDRGSPVFDEKTAHLSSHDISAAEDLPEIRKSHKWDPNLPQAEIDALNDAIKTGDVEKIAEVEHTFAEDSPYEEVRAAVRTTDDGSVANTVRAWILGMIFVTVGSGLNMFLSMRSPAINFPAIVVQLVVYPIGCLWARIVPMKVFNTFGVKWTFNAGPFTIKEHVVITLMSSVSIGYAYSTDALLALKAKPLYNIDLGWGFQLLFTLSSQLIGIALAGMFRRFLIWPSAMMWPGQFSSTSLFYALHDKKKSDVSETNGWSISRYRYFLYVTIGAFLWYWVPGVLWQGLSVFAFITWIKPNNVIVNQLFGGYTGLSLIPITFDWTYVSGYLSDPLLAPVHALYNTLAGLIVFVILSAIGISYTNTFYSDYLPMSTSTTYDNTQSSYNVSKILTPEYTFNITEYKSYSPMFLAPTFILNYGLSFAALTAAIVQTVLFNGSEVWYRFKAARNQEPDIHMKLMKKYNEAPDWWYGALFVLSIALGLATTLGFDSQLPWWGFFVSNIIGLVFIIPTCMILATTNIMLSLNVISPFLAGFMIPGKPIGVMMFKVFSTITLGQAQTYCGDLKLAHYMKVPPKTVFWCQIVASIWACFVQIAVMNWTLGAIDGVCTQTQSSHFTCPNGRTFFSSSIVWGVIGPERMFGPGHIYSSINWYWLLGALLPVAFYLLMRYFPRSPLRLLNAPVMLGAMAWLPPATPLSFSTWVIFGLLFNEYLRSKYPGWWHHYNYITAAGLDSGLVISTIIIFFAITLPNVTIPQWWGNVGVYNTLDASYDAVRKMVNATAGEYFGPRAGGW
ncbi:related to small oligopeptide transporter, OPT family [Phialocephala subalpina]|uniref:Related to small oligopeptide transporter, OPT family n=1 Tax=Phialocephala subalpina TaxID=576137 RepID=A0A1L7XH27_9HELO|nr:related to small oligopeptide transporter, OPT family [Phialocephala subalpina]